MADMVGTSEQADLPEASVAAPPRAQFSLRFLFLLTTAISAALGLALAKGWGTLPLSLGMIWATMNAAGMLRSVQHTPRARSNWIWLAWLLFLISLGLPVSKGCNAETIRGWQAGGLAASSLGDLAREALSHEGSLSERWREVGPLRTAFVLTLLNAGNLALLLAPLAIVLFRYGYGHWQTNLAGLSGVMFWMTMWDINAMPQSGVVVWCLSSLALQSARQLPWRIWCGMVSLALISLGSLLL